MEDFQTKLLSFPVWNDKKFVDEQLKHHLIECLELLEKWDPHLYNELIDLIQIAKVELRTNLEQKEIEEKYKARFDKFISKSKENKEWKKS